MAETYMDLDMKNKDIDNVANLGVTTLTSSSITATNLTASTQINTPRITSSSGTLAIKADIENSANDIYTNTAYVLGGIDSANSYIPVGKPFHMGSNQINEVQDPTSAQDVATKNYVDSQITGITPFTSQTELGSYNNVPSSYTSIVSTVFITTNPNVRVFLIASGAADMDSATEGMDITLTKDGQPLGETLNLESIDSGEVTGWTRNYVDTPGVWGGTYGLRARSNGGSADLKNIQLSLFSI